MNTKGSDFQGGRLLGHDREINRTDHIVASMMRNGREIGRLLLQGVSSLYEAVRALAASTDVEARYGVVNVYVRNCSQGWAVEKQYHFRTPLFG